MHKLYARLHKVVLGTKKIIVPTCTIVHPYIYVIVVTEVRQIPKNLCNRNQACKALQRLHICLTDSGNDFIIDEMKH